MKKIRLFYKKIFNSIKIKQLSLDEALDYWRNPDDGSNLPQNYVGDGKNVHKSLVNDKFSHKKRSEMLVGLVSKYVSSESLIIEIGCNVGRNLNYLYDSGFENLEAIEISENAIRLLKEKFPKLASKLIIYNDPVEKVIKGLETDKYDVTFTMAVLEHVHPDSEWIFPEMARMTKDYLITAEDESSVTKRHFPRNYRKIFEKLGMQQIESLQCNKIEHGLPPSFCARVFRKNQ